MTLALAGLALIASALAIGCYLRARDLERDLAEEALERAKADFEAARLRQHAEDVLVPLTWLWDRVADYDDAWPEEARTRAYLVAAYQEVQKALLQDDVEMTETMIEARSAQPPRRLPRFPQTPPFLANPEDVAGVIRAPGPVDAAAFEREWAERGGVTVRPLPRHDFDVVTTRAKAPVMPERFFVFRHVDGWAEVDAQTYETSMASDHETYKVSAGASPESVPEEIRSLIWAPPREEGPEPVALDDES